MKAVAVIVLNLFACTLFAYGVYLTENQLEHRMSLSPPLTVEYNLDEVVIEASPPADVGVARIRTSE